MVKIVRVKFCFYASFVLTRFGLIWRHQSNWREEKKAVNKIFINASELRAGSIVTLLESSILIYLLNLVG